jgi:putative flippase GtrA
MSFFIYVLVQLISYALDLSVFYCIYHFVGVEPVLANVVSRSVAGVFAFFGHRRFTFGAHVGENLSRQATLYFTSLLINIPISSLLLWTIMLAGTGAITAKLLADGCGVAINFVFSKFVTFRKTEHI